MTTSTLNRRVMRTESATSIGEHQRAEADDAESPPRARSIFPKKEDVAAADTRLLHWQLRIGWTGMAALLMLVVAGVAAIGIPQHMRANEAAKAASAYTFLEDVRSAQEHFRDRHGAYASAIQDLDLRRPTPPYFSVGVLSAHGKTGWSLTLNRAQTDLGYGPDFGFGPYVIAFDQDGFDAHKSNLNDSINPHLNGSPGEQHQGQ